MAGCSPQLMEMYLRIGLCSQQAEHSASAVARSVLAWVHTIGPIAALSLCHHGYCSCTHYASSGVALDRGWLVSTAYTWLFSASSMVYILCWVWTWTMMIFTLGTHSHRSNYRPLPQISFFPIFQSYSFQSPNQPDKLFTTAHETMYILILGLFSFHKKWMTRCNV